MALEALDNQPTQPDSSSSSSPLQSAVQIAAPKSTGIQGTIAMDPTATKEILNNMQDFIDQRTSGWSKFMGGINRAYAAAHGPESLVNYDRQKAAEDQQIMNYQQQMAAYGAAQKQEDAIGKSLQQIGVGVGGNVPNSVNGVNLPPSVKNELALARSNSEQRDILQNYFKTEAGNASKFANEPASFVQQQGFIKNIGYVDWNPQQWQYFKTAKNIGMDDKDAVNYAQNFGDMSAISKQEHTNTTRPRSMPQIDRQTGKQTTDFNAIVNNLIDNREGGYSAADSNGYPVNMGINGGANPGVDIKNLTRDQATQIYKNKYWDPVGIGNLPHDAAVVAFDASVNQGPEYAKDLIAKTGGDAQKMYAQRAVDYNNLANSNPAKYGALLPVWNKRLGDVSGEVADVIRQRNGVPFVQGDTFDSSKYGTKAEADAAKKDWEDTKKANLQAGSKEADTAAEEAGKAQSEMNKLARAASEETMPAAKAVLDIVEDPNRKHVAGYLHGGDKTATALYTISKHVSNKTPAELEEEYVTNKFSPKELEDYRTISNASQKLGIQFAAQVFHGARMGIGLEKMAMGAKGIGTELPPEVNARNARLIHDAADFQIKKQQMWDSWSKANGGRLASFDQFERSPEYTSFRDQAKQHFIDTYRGLVKPEDSVADRARAEIERRKAAQGTK
jgi:hypothetical protein